MRLAVSFEQFGDVVTVHDLCKMLGIGLNSAYTLVNTNAIASIRLRRKILIPKKAVIDYLTGSNTGAESSMNPN